MPINITRRELLSKQDVATIQLVIDNGLFYKTYNIRKDDDKKQSYTKRL